METCQTNLQSNNEQLYLEVTAQIFSILSRSHSLDSTILCKIMKRNHRTMWQHSNKLSVSVFASFQDLFLYLLLMWERIPWIMGFTLHSSSYFSLFLLLFLILFCPPWYVQCEICIYGFAFPADTVSIQALMLHFSPAFKC